MSCKSKVIPPLGFYMVIFLNENHIVVEGKQYVSLQRFSEITFELASAIDEIEHLRALLKESLKEN